MGKFCLIIRFFLFIYSCLCLFFSAEQEQFCSSLWFIQERFCLPWWFAWIRKRRGSWWPRMGEFCFVSHFMWFFLLFLRVFVCSLLSMPGTVPIAIILVRMDTTVHNQISLEELINRLQT